MEPAAGDTDHHQGLLQDLLQDLPELDTITGVSQGFLPEGLFFWRRWRHPKTA